MKLRQLSIAVLLAVAIYGCSPHQPVTSTKNTTKDTTSANVTEKTTDAPFSGSESGQAVESAEAQLFDDLGNHKRRITTASLETQKYFNQGLTWMYAFNHDEAIRSFTSAAEIDEDCAMAWWGISLAAGPQYNHAAMTKNRTATAWEAMHKALARIENTSSVERALIRALKYRNANLESEDQTHLNQAYAQAMEKVWKAYPNDSDVGTLFAEAMMVRRPWKLYSLDHQPHEDTPKIIETLERVLEIEPNHPGALHLYIHVVEPSGDPGRGLAAAGRLSDLVPASGHLLHMPSHIYVKTGFWEKAIVQNRKAMAADKAYRAQSPEQLTQHVYMTHNAHMRAFASMMTGREEEAMTAARDMWENVSEETLRQLGPALDRWMCSVYDVQKRFGRWDAILNEPAPHAFMPVTTATWRAARAVAYAAKKDFRNAQVEHDAFKRAKAGVPDNTPWGRDVAQRVLEVSDYFIAGEIALQKGEWGKASDLLEKAAAIEDTLSYGEPPQWLQPVRHTLGAVYMKTSNYSEAERVYREDLAEWPSNGWSLYGLSRALEQQGKTEAAKGALEEHKRIWAKADAPIETTCKCIPKT